MLRKNYVKTLMVSLVIIWFLIPFGSAQDEKLKAIFVYNFTRYISWPDKTENFVIIVLGKSPVTSELSDIALKKRVGNTPIEIRSANSSQEIGECKIVYVTSSKTDLIAEILPALKNRNILIVSEKEGACKAGSAINFITKDGKLGFEISKSSLSACGLTVSSTLFPLAAAVNE